MGWRTISTTMVLPDEWQSPLASRYASVEVRTLFSDRSASDCAPIVARFGRIRARTGPPITSEQIEELKGPSVTSILTKPATRPNFTMSWPTSTPGAMYFMGRPVNSQLQRGSHHAKRWLGSDCRALASVIDALGTFAQTHRGILPWDQPTSKPPTHHRGQASHRVVLGFVLALEEVERSRMSSVVSKGPLGPKHHSVCSTVTTTSGSLERLVAERMRFSAEQLHPVTGQTYPRLVDAKVLGHWASSLRLPLHVRLLAGPG